MVTTSGHPIIRLHSTNDIKVDTWILTYNPKENVIILCVNFTIN